MSDVTAIAIEASRQREKAARTFVYEMCDGSRRWTMSIPVRETDSDVVICDALADGARFREALKVAADALAEVSKVEANRDAAEENEDLSYSGEAARDALERIAEILEGK